MDDAFTIPASQMMFERAFDVLQVSIGFNCQAISVEKLEATFDHLGFTMD